jgi:hypothetical protein
MLLSKSHTTTDAPSFVGSCGVLVLVVVTVSEGVVFDDVVDASVTTFLLLPILIVDLLSPKMQYSPDVVEANPGQRLRNRVFWPRNVGHLGMLLMSEKRPVPLLRWDFHWILLNRVPIFVG